MKQFHLFRQDLVVLDRLLALVVLVDQLDLERQERLYSLLGLEDLLSLLDLVCQVHLEVLDRL